MKRLPYSRCFLINLIPYSLGAPFFTMDIMPNIEEPITTKIRKNMTGLETGGVSSFSNFLFLAAWPRLSMFFVYFSEASLVLREVAWDGREGGREGWVGGGWKGREGKGGMSLC